jgi:hypothetical protein
MKLTLLAIPGLVLALSGSAFASQTWQEQSIATGLAAMDSAPVVTAANVKARAVRMAIGRLPAGSPAFFANNVMTGAAVNGVPCFSCVEGAPDNALGIPSPFNYIPSGTVQQYNVSWTDLTYNGACTVFVSVASGKTVIGSAQFKATGITGPGAYDLGFNLASTTFSGSAMATGKVKCGSKTSTASAPVIFE